MSQTRRHAERYRLHVTSEHASAPNRKAPGSFLCWHSGDPVLHSAICLLRCFHQRSIEYERPNAEAGSYGPAYRRLQKVKAQYDPRNLFRLNNNVQPAA